MWVVFMEREPHDERSPSSRFSDAHEAALAFRMLVVVHRSDEWIAENRFRFLKRDAVLPQVLFRFARIPRNFHAPEATSVLLIAATLVGAYRSTISARRWAGAGDGDRCLVRIAPFRDQLAQRCVDLLGRAEDVVDVRLE